MSKSYFKIIECSPENYDIAKEFVFNYEHLCVDLSSLLLKEFTNFFVLYECDDLDTQLNELNIEQILGVIYLNQSFLFCIPIIDKILQKKNFSSEFFKLINLIKEKQIKMMMGESETCKTLLELLEHSKIKPIQTTKYNIMILNEKPYFPPEKLSCDDYIKSCTIDDYDDLFTLQKNFLIKEVALNNQKITDSSCDITLKQILKNQIVFALCSDSKFVSKVNTNAIGKKYVQLGGIYTDPLFRHNYYAWHLIYKISERIQKTNRKICLFVKERNNPAILLYKRIGFEEKGKLSIIYF